MKSLELIVNGSPCGLLVGADECETGGQRTPTDICRLGPGAYSVLVGREQHAVVVRQTAAGTYEACVAGTTLSIEVCDPRRLSRQVAGAASGGAQPVRAPMPGRVLAVRVRVGDEVASEQGLLVVEAMKMQNELRSPLAGRVTAVNVRAGDSVSSGDTLVVVE